jgi:GcrA cell cycle regulator
MEWTAEQLRKLRELWFVEPQISTAKIGIEVNMSKNAVVGKARRIGLPGRPSPITHHPDGPRPPRRKTMPPPVVTLPVLTSVGACPDAPPPQPPLVVAAVTVRTGRERPCCWPFGEPGSKGFRYCGAPAEIGRPYCEDHCRLAYRKLHDRREAA